MKCPVCKTVDLVMADRNGIEIDYCPSCRGVWLDRGELDKIIERAGGAYAAPPPQQNAAPVYRDDDYYDDDHYKRTGQYYDKSKNQQYPPKKKSLLGEIFDIFD